MFWWRPFKRKNDYTRTVWSYTFQFNPDLHPQPDQLEPLKQSYDTLGEQTLERLQTLTTSLRPILSQKLTKGTPSEQHSKKSPEATQPEAKEDLYTLLKDHAESDAVLGRFWDEVNTIPPWVDWAQIARGQEVFYRYGGPFFTGLAFQSLLGGMAAARVVEVLARTGGFSTKVARSRMFETTQFILQCTQSLEAVQPGGAGHVAAIRVRLLHALVRQKILKIAEERPEYYNVKELGVPINDLDSIGTIMTFSASLIWISLPRQGIFLRREEVVDFIALWRYIAYLTGTPNEYFADPESAITIMEVLMLYEMKPTETSKILANNVIRSLEAQPPSFASRSMLEASSRFLNGDDLCDALGLGRPSFYYTVLVAGQCIFFMAICYTYRSFSFLDRRKIAVSG